MAELKDVEIFAVGTWIGSGGPMKWSEEDMESIVTNTNMLMNSEEFKITPRLKLGHSYDQIGWEDAHILDGQMDGDPALGKITNFRTKGTGKNKTVIADFVNMPDIIYNTIEKELYTNVSAELEFSKGVGWYITAVALLGADIPAVKAINDLQAFLSDKIADLKSVENVRLAFSQPKINGDVMPEDVKDKKDTQVSDPSITKLIDTNMDLRRNFSEKEKEVTTLNSKLEEKDKELAQYRKQALKAKFSEQREKILAPYEQDVKAQVLMPAMLDKIKACLNEQEANFSEDSKLSISPELAREVVQSYAKVNFNEEGAGSGSSKNDNNEGGLAPDEVVAKECKILQAQRNISYSEASKQLILEKPEIWKAYTDYTREVSDLGRLMV